MKIIIFITGFIFGTLFCYWMLSLKHSDFTNKYGVKPNDVFDDDLALDANILEDTPFLTREEVLQPPPLDPYFPVERGGCYYVELDLNLNGFKHIIISDPLYEAGTGGNSWSVFLCVGTNQYRQSSVRLGGWTLVGEDIDEGTRIWTYWRLRGSEGIVKYTDFYNDGEIYQNSGISIYPGDGGTELGNDIYKTIFKNETFKLKYEWLPQVAPTNELKE